MDSSSNTLPDDPDVLKALLIAERQTLAIARADLVQAEALAAIAQAEVTDAYALIEELKLRIAKASRRSSLNSRRTCVSNMGGCRARAISPRRSITWCHAGKASPVSLMMAVSA